MTRLQKFSWTRYKNDNYYVFVFLRSITALLSLLPPETRLRASLRESGIPTIHMYRRDNISNLEEPPALTSLVCMGRTMLEIQPSPDVIWIMVKSASENLPDFIKGRIQNQYAWCGGEERTQARQKARVHKLKKQNTKKVLKAFPFA